MIEDASRIGVGSDPPERMNRMELTGERCVACQKGAPQATAEETARWLPQLDGWEVIEVDGVKRLQMVFKTQGFMGALDLANKVGALAEAEGHHPSLLVEWGKLTVTWWTHKIKGLHRNDFIMAAKSNEAAGSTRSSGLGAGS
jgi:4a-hydroxytetrahydrobiopterin dehydratase